MLIEVLLLDLDLDLGPLSQTLLLQHSSGCDILDSLIAKFEILLERNGICDSDKNQGSCDQKSTGAQAPLVE